MNRTLDGMPLTTDHLRALAVADGADPDKLAAVVASLHNGHAIRSHLLALTAPVRLGMFDRGELRLDTRPTDATPGAPATVDVETFEFLTGTTVHVHA